LRIAQIVIAPVVRADWNEVPNLKATSRNDGGFGHTGT
jgi:dUTP pyrophosphatase